MSIDISLPSITVVFSGSVKKTNVRYHILTSFIIQCNRCCCPSSTASCQREKCWKLNGFLSKSPLKAWLSMHPRIILLPDGYWCLTFQCQDNWCGDVGYGSCLLNDFSWHTSKYTVGIVNVLQKTRRIGYFAVSLSNVLAWARCTEELILTFQINITAPVILTLKG